MFTPVNDSVYTFLLTPVVPLLNEQNAKNRQIGAKLQTNAEQCIWHGVGQLTAGENSRF